MAKEYLNKVDQWIVNNVASPVINFANSFAKMWGVDLLERWGGRKNSKWDWNTLQDVINKVFSETEIRNDRELAEFNNKLEATIGLNPSPAVKSLLNRWKKQIREKIHDKNAENARLNLKKTEATNAANALDNMGLGDWKTDEGEKQKTKFINAVKGTVQDAPEKTREDLKQVKGWEDIGSINVEKPL